MMLLVLCMLSLAACNKEKEGNKSKKADDILESIVTDTKNFSAVAKFDVNGSLNPSLLNMFMFFGDAAEFSDEEPMKLAVSGKADAKVTEKAVFTEGNYKFTLDGDTDDAKFKEYAVIDKDEITVYSYDYDSKEWSGTLSDISDYSMPDMSQIKDTLKYLKDAKNENGTITAKLDVKAIAKDNGLDDEDTLKALTKEDITVTVTVNKDNTLKSISFDLASYVKSVIKEMEFEDYITIDKLSVNVEFSDINKTKVELPKELDDVEVTESGFGDFDWDDDDWDFDDDDSWGSDDDNNWSSDDTNTDSSSDNKDNTNSSNTVTISDVSSFVSIDPAKYNGAAKYALDRQELYKGLTVPTTYEAMTAKFGEPTRVTGNLYTWEKGDWKIQAFTVQKFDSATQDYINYNVIDEISIEPGFGKLNMWADLDTDFSNIDETNKEYTYNDIVNLTGSKGTVKKLEDGPSAKLAAYNASSATPRPRYTIAWYSTKDNKSMYCTFDYLTDKVVTITKN